MLPTFLGIGVPRSGTTWLHDMLASHPDVLTGQGRKEVRYFNHNYERGVGWYERFFPLTTPTPHAIGEFTPGYLFEPAAPARVARLGTVDQLLVSFRDPIDRLVSHYRARQRVDHFRGTLEEFVLAYPHSVDHGRYATHLGRWLDEFDRSQLLIVQFESAVKDVAGTKVAMAQHLHIDVARFPIRSGSAAKNEAFSPRQPRTYALAKRTVRRLRRHDIDLGDRVGDHLRGRALRRTDAGRPAPVDPDVRRRLADLYRPEVERLEVQTGMSFRDWPCVAAPS